MQSSFPAEQAQPNQEFYGLDVLALFQNYTRDLYRASGNGDPVVDPARPEQNWWDDTYAGSAADESITFNAVVWADDGTATIGSFTQRAAWMRTPNFRGLPSFPKWIPAATQATRGGAAIDVAAMSTEAQARELMADLGGSSIVDFGLRTLVIQGVTLLQPISYPASEPRRLWSVVMADGTSVNVGSKLARKYSAGVGHPGQWVADLSEEGGINWQPDALPDGSNSGGKPLPVPCRPLKPNEELQIFMVAAWAKGTRVHRTDWNRAASSAAEGNTDTVAIEDIKTKVTALYNLLVPHS